MHVVSVRLSDQEKALLDSYAKQNYISISQIIKKAIFERLEDEFDAKIADEAHFNLVKDPIVIDAGEMKQRYGL
ncbi:MAG: ribbon-helix-helix domain-containing protein [Bacilli bacterium]|jgi:predicted transcriptional regulator|nr:ribbon-helix-helix domain-containing protein [Bacilli bacterium]MCH4211115.1 ribbon-helix-helix domain-containing protein [Bacilli bacterium]MCH4228712.1 ribbon-helix-helix domain-containing protein [Bacilli bacterium]MCH4278110.1 ribbon-helix-helix domain-containing protein [Bacilli bacterium]